MEARLKIKSKEVVAINPALFEEEEDVVEEMGEQDKGNQKQREQEFVSHVPLSGEKAIECMVMEKKKHELLSKYMREDLMEEQANAKTMLNI
jgi:hypothetical protein